MLGPQPVMKQLGRLPLADSSPTVTSPASFVAPIPSSKMRSSPDQLLHTGPAQRNQVPTARQNFLDDFSPKNKVIVVSGGARGLSLVQPEALLEAGAIVHCIDRLPPPTEDPTSEFSRIAKRAGRELDTSLTYYQTDVRDVKDLNSIVEQIASREGRIDGLIAAAGVNHETAALDHSVEDFDNVLSINVTGIFMTAQAVARQMVRLGQKGSICLIASMSGTIANKGMLAPAYNASKAAVIQLCRNLAAEWGKYGIRVNTLSRLHHDPDASIVA